MSLAEKPRGRFLSEIEYLDFELVSTMRHEYVDGVVYAKTGASVGHNSIVGAIYFQLRSQLRAPCKAHMTDVKLRIQRKASIKFYYPDLMVACSPQDNAEYWKTMPTLLVEVLSPRTERIDRGEKLTAYTQIPTLQAYLIVAQEVPRIDAYLRNVDDWEHRLFGAGQTMHLAEGELSLNVDAIYAD